jgi:stage V sporulation protein R
MSAAPGRAGGAGGTWRDWVRPVAEAARAIGLAPCETEFLEVPADTLYDLAAYGLPGMYSHWSFGQSRWRSKGEFDAGISKIHELVTHTQPAYAYLLDHNSLSEHIFVMAHVMGHADFFARNVLLRGARTDMLPLLREATLRFQRYELEYGPLAVERLLDLAHALMWHVEPLAPPRPEERRPAATASPFADLLDPPPPKEPSPDQRLAERRRQRWGTPCPDPLYFLISQAPIEPWERDVLQVVREVGLHYRPQVRTKVMNEGWAVRACLKILGELDLPAETHLAAAQLHAQVARPDPLHLNPYWLGWRLFEHLEATGRDVAAIAELESDVSFLANWVDADFVRREQLYNWDAVRDGDAVLLRESTRAWERVRDRLVASHTPAIPPVAVEEVAPDGTLRLRLGAPHPIDLPDARCIVRGMARIWRAPVQLRAAQDDGEPLCAAGPTDPDPEEEEPR